MYEQSIEKYRIKQNSREKYTMYLFSTFKNDRHRMQGTIPRIIPACSINWQIREGSQSKTQKRRKMHICRSGTSKHLPWWEDIFILTFLIKIWWVVILLFLSCTWLQNRFTVTVYCNDTTAWCGSYIFASVKYEKVSFIFIFQ